MLEDILKDGFRELDLEINEEQISRLRIYRDYLAEINDHMNLTAITEEDEVARLHFLDCAALLKFVDFKGKTVIDVGTGAGFPGLVLKILEPDIRLTLLDSLDKRIGFLKDCCEKLGIYDVACIHARAEEIDSGRREKFDIACSRAVARLNILSEICLPYVKQDGCFIAMKGPDFEDELDEAKKCIKELGAKTESCEAYSIPGTEITHSAIVIRKKNPTPSAYPRRWAQIKKTPLK